MAELRINGAMRVMNGSTNMRTLKEMNDLLTTLNNRKASIMTAFLTNRPKYSSTSGNEWTWQKINLSQVQSFGSNFSLSNGGIKANKAMKALVSAQLVHWTYTNASEEFDIAIHKNGSNNVVLQSHGNMSKNLQHHIISPAVVDLAANDVLYFGFIPGAVTSFTLIGDGNTTFMTLQEIIQ